MRGCFIDHGNEPNYDLLRRRGINEVLIPGENSPMANPVKVKEAYDRGFKVTVMFAWNWTGGFATGALFARWCHERLKTIGHPAVNPEVMLDIETGAGLNQFNYADWVADCITEWRKLRPQRATYLTLESMQGGCFNGKAAQQAKVISGFQAIIPQYYTGDERPQAGDVALRDLLLYGFPYQMLRGFYLARDLPINWNGYAWTQGKLPT